MGIIKLKRNTKNKKLEAEPTEMPIQLKNYLPNDAFFIIIIICFHTGNK